MFYGIEVTALWWPLQYLDFVVLSHFATTLEVCLGSLSIWKTNLRPSFNFQTDVLRWCFNISTIFLLHDAIYFVKCTSPTFSKAPPQHDAATPVLHGWDGVHRLASIPLFPSNITIVFMAIMAFFVSSDQRTFLQKVRSLSQCAVTNRSLAFVWWFWSSGILPCWVAFQVM